MGRRKHNIYNSTISEAEKCDEEKPCEEESCRSVWNVCELTADELEYRQDITNKQDSRQHVIRNCLITTHAQTTLTYTRSRPLIRRFRVSYHDLSPTEHMARIPEEPSLSVFGPAHAVWSRLARTARPLFTPAQPVLSAHSYPLSASNPDRARRPPCNLEIQSGRRLGRSDKQSMSSRRNRRWILASRLSSFPNG